MSASLFSPLLAQGFLSGVFGGGSGAAASPAAVFTPQQAQQAFDFSRNFGRNLEGIYGLPVKAPGADVTQTSKVPGQEIKAREYAKYLASKGFTPEMINKKIHKIHLIL